jgi:hypothetical protein
VDELRPADDQDFVRPKPEGDDVGGFSAAPKEGQPVALELVEAGGGLRRAATVYRYRLD